MEADRPAHLVHPVDGGRPVTIGERPTRDGADRCEHRLPVGDTRRDVGELRQHRLHQRRVEGVADAQPRHPAAPLPRHRHHPLDRVLVTGHHHRRGAVDRRDRGPISLRKPSEDVGDLGLSALDRRHRTPRRQRLHQPGTARHQPGSIRQLEHTRRVRGGELTDGMAEHRIRTDAPGTQQLDQRHLHREQRRLRVPGLLQQGRLRRTLRREQHLPHRHTEARPARKLRVQMCTRLVQGPREHRELLVQLAAHAESLAALPGEHPRRTPLAHGTRHHRIAIEVDEASAQCGALGAQHHRTVLQRGACGGQGQPDVDGCDVPPVEVGRQASGLCPHRLGVPAGQHPRHHRRLGRRPLFGHDGFGSRGFFDDDVCVGPADAER